MCLGFLTSGGRKFLYRNFRRLWNGPRSVPACRRNCSFATASYRTLSLFSCAVQQPQLAESLHQARHKDDAKRHRARLLDEQRTVSSKACRVALHERKRRVIQVAARNQRTSIGTSNVMTGALSNRASTSASVAVASVETKNAVTRLSYHCIANRYTPQFTAAPSMIVIRRLP